MVGYVDVCSFFKVFATLYVLYSRFHFRSRFFIIFILPCHVPVRYAQSSGLLLTHGPASESLGPSVTLGYHLVKLIHYTISDPGPGPNFIYQKTPVEGVQKI